MGRSLSVLAAFLLACVVAAAPAPVSKPFPMGWGNPIDPDKDCKFKRDKDGLMIEMPGTDHGYDPIRKRINAPRFVCDIEGEFEIQVRVQINCRPSAQSTVKGQPSGVSAGILLVYPEPYRAVCDRIEFGILQQGMGLDNFPVKPLLVRQQRERERKGIGEDGYVALISVSSKKINNKNIWDRECLDQSHSLYDRGWAKWPLPMKANFAYLKLQYVKGRERGGFYYFFSPDGEKWSGPGSHFGGMPTKLKLGLAAYSTSSEPSRVRFDQLKLARIRKKD
jgi:hypothetical protein